MHMSTESLLVILLVGLIAGWLAGRLVQGTGFGLVGDLVLGILGAFVGAWLLPRIGLTEANALADARCGALARASSRATLSASVHETDRAVICASFLDAGCRRGERALYFSPAEVAFLIAGPYRKRHLLAYKLFITLALCSVSAAFFSLAIPLCVFLAFQR